MSTEPCCILELSSSLRGEFLLGKMLIFGLVFFQQIYTFKDHHQEIHHVHISPKSLFSYGIKKKSQWFTPVMLAT
jgi:hypothetical protein